MKKLIFTLLLIVVSGLIAYDRLFNEVSSSDDAKSTYEATPTKTMLALDEELQKVESEDIAIHPMVVKILEIQERQKNLAFYAGLKMQFGIRGQTAYSYIEDGIPAELLQV